MSIYKASYQNDKYSALLQITGYNGSSESLSAEIGLVSTYSVAGDPSHAIARKRRNRWEYQIVSGDVVTADEILSKLVEIIYPKKKLLKDLSGVCDVRLSVVTTTYNYNPEIVLSHELLAKLNDLGLEIWFDTYCYQISYLEESEQQKELTARLIKSESAKKLGIINEETARVITEVLSIYEKSKTIIYEDLFPDYAGGESATEQDIHKGLIAVRQKLRELHDAIEKSSFLMG